MRLALMIEGQEGVTWDDWVALASACEEHGVEALFRSDHYISWFDDSRRVLDAWATLAGLAARTTRLELGTLVSPATFRHPSVLARNAATVDEISSVRVTVGLGAGWQRLEHEAYGFEFGTARERVFGEQLEIVRGLLGEERLSFDGAYYKLVDAPGLGRPEVNLLVGGSAKPGTAGPAARFADEYNTLFSSLDELRRRQRALDEACTGAGRDPATLRRSLMAPVVLGRDERELQDSARRIAVLYDRDPKDVLEGNGDHAPTGTVEQVAERLKRLEELGYERVMLQHLAHQDLDTVALIGRELAPAVA
jgi:alkanesulfonate monooxygenase SsuD/methylene tetrahydromethanopterin reductase-like flavin-dependent oxidoreductase (luciferase family)